MLEVKAKVEERKRKRKKVIRIRIIIIIIIKTQTQVNKQGVEVRVKFVRNKEIRNSLKCIILQFIYNIPPFLIRWNPSANSSQPANLDQIWRIPTNQYPVMTYDVNSTEYRQKGTDIEHPWWQGCFSSAVLVELEKIMKNFTRCSRALPKNMTRTAPIQFVEYLIDQTPLHILNLPRKRQN